VYACAYWCSTLYPIKCRSEFLVVMPATIFTSRRCSVRLYLQLFIGGVGRGWYVLFTLFVFAQWAWRNYNNLPLVLLLLIKSSLLNSQIIIWTGPVKLICFTFVKMPIRVIFYVKIETEVVKFELFPLKLNSVVEFWFSKRVKIIWYKNK